MNNLKRHILTTLLVQLFCINAFGQYNDINAVIAKADIGKYTVEYVKADSSFQTKKPVLFFLQGSRTFPLIFTDGVNKTHEILFWMDINYKSLAEKYHLVMLANPGVPAEADFSELNSDMNYVIDVTNPVSYPEEYQKNNNKEFFTNRAMAFLKYLRKQKWVDASRIYLVGHSQGTYIAIDVANRTNHIAGVGLFSASPLGRASQYVNRTRIDDYRGIRSANDVQTSVDNIYGWYQWQKDNIGFIPTDGSDSPLTTCSFSGMPIFDIAKLKQPVYVAYGTRDAGAMPCDYLPIAFINSGKKDWKVRAYPGYDHNFHETDKEWNSLYDKPHWREVMNEFIHWIESK